MVKFESFNILVILHRSVLGFVVQCTVYTVQSLWPHSPFILSLRCRGDNRAILQQKQVIFMEVLETMEARRSSHGNKWTNPGAINSVLILLSSIKASREYFQNKGRNKEPKK